MGPSWSGDLEDEAEVAVAEAGASIDSAMSTEPVQPGEANHLDEAVSNIRRLVADGAWAEAADLVKLHLSQVKPGDPREATLEELESQATIMLDQLGREASFKNCTSTDIDVEAFSSMIEGLFPSN